MLVSELGAKVRKPSHRNELEFQQLGSLPAARASWPSQEEPYEAAEAEAGGAGAAGGGGVLLFGSPLDAVVAAGAHGLVGGVCGMA